MRFFEVMTFYDYKMSNVSRALKVTLETIRRWKKMDKIPFSKQCELEVLSKGALKANKEDA